MVNSSERRDYIRLAALGSGSPDLVDRIRDFCSACNERSPVFIGRDIGAAV